MWEKVAEVDVEVRVEEKVLSKVVVGTRERCDREKEGGSIVERLALV